jgi:hypothetical protein
MSVVDRNTHIAHELHSERIASIQRIYGGQGVYVYMCVCLSVRLSGCLVCLVSVYVSEASEALCEGSGWWDLPRGQDCTPSVCGWVHVCGFLVCRDGVVLVVCMARRHACVVCVRCPRRYRCSIVRILEKT